MRKKQIKDDPLGSYERKCPFCGEKFNANHKHRRFCPEKNNIPNFCKHQYKGLIEEERLSQIPIHSVAETNIPVMELPPVEIPVINIEALNTNKRIIQSVLQDKREIKVSYETLLSLGIDLTSYDEKLN